MSIIDMKAAAKSNEPLPNGKSVPSPASEVGLQVGSDGSSVSAIWATIFLEHAHWRTVRSTTELSLIGIS